MNLLNLYSWYLEDQDILTEMAIMFSEEVELSDEQSIEFFKLIYEEKLSSTELALLIEENYGDNLTTDTYVDLLEFTAQSELIRKQRIEKARSKLGQQFRHAKTDSSSQRLNKSTLSLTTYKIDQEGRFVLRSKPGDPAKVRANLEAKRIRSLSTKAKTDAAKATVKRDQSYKAGGKSGAGKFIRNLKLAA